MRKEPKSLTFDEFADELLTEQQPRALVILASAKIDMQLRQSLEKFLLPKFAKVKDDDELFDSMNPLSTFSSRIKLTHRLGLIDASLAETLNKLRELRNQAAHWTSFGVAEAPLRDQLRNLKSLIIERKSYGLTVSRFFTDSNLNELETVKAVLLTLCVILESIQIRIEEQSLSNVQKPIKVD